MIKKGRPLAFTIIIENGLHAGAVQRLGPGIYTIGSELSADIVLSDPGIIRDHAIFEIDDVGLRLEPNKGPISVDGENGHLEPGDERNLNLPATFQIGEASISIRAPKDAEQSKRRKRLAIGAMAAGLLLVVGLYAIGPLSSTFSRPSPKSENQAAIEGGSSDPVLRSNEDAVDTEMASKTPSADAITKSSAPMVTMDQAAAELRDKLATATLDTIDVIVRKDHLVADGDIETEKMPDWQSVQIWFDSTYGHKIPLMPNVGAREKVKPPKLAIEAIWVGSSPYLMAGGRRYFEGADLGNGWRIDRIDAEQITLRRGDQTYAISL